MNSSGASSGASHALIDNFFRHEYGRLVAVLTRVLGPARLELVEDVVQSALVQALETWGRRGVPDDPGGWLFRVAKNLALDALRRQQTWQRLQPALAAETEVAVSDALLEQVHFATEIGDETLRMLFVTCDPALPIESRIALALRVLCGFGLGEIARGLLTTEANVQKRITRAKEILRNQPQGLEPLSAEAIASRRPAVHLVLYLLFNEGYNSASPDTLIREDVCEEALRLTTLLASHPPCASPETFALLALMCFHAARFESRLNDQGDVLLLAEQDRARWDRSLIDVGRHWLDRSAEAAFPSRYHVEAGIAFEHCRAASFSETNWARIVALYDLLLAREPAPLQHLNRAVALAEWQGPAAGLAALDALPAPPIAERYHLWPAVRADFLRRLNRWAEAERELARALVLVMSNAERKLLAQRWQECRDAQAAAGSDP